MRIRNLFLSFVLVSATIAADKTTIGIQKISLSPAVEAQVGGSNSQAAKDLMRMSGSMGEQLIDTLHNTRKFEIVSRSDLQRVLDEQEVQSAFANPDDPKTAQAFQMAGCKYTLIVTIDDYSQTNEQLKGHSGQILAAKQNVSISAVAKLYDTTTGVLFESANVVYNGSEKELVQSGAIREGAHVGSKIAVDAAKTMSSQIAIRVMDIVYPAKILGKTGSHVLINRGDSTGILPGEIWNVYKLEGERIIDPDTGEVLADGIEVLVGAIEITEVLPKFSKTQIVDDNGIAGPVGGVYQIARQKVR